jgi:rare lipoprotein A
MIKITLISSLAILLLSCAGPSPRYTSLDSGVSSAHKSTSTKNKAEKSTSKKSTKKKSSSGSSSTKKNQMEGEASWYGPGFQGKKTANGERFNMYSMTAAHKTLPFNTIVEVTDLDTGKKIKVRINDRGPYAKGRIIDLSKKAAEKLGVLKKGHARVKLRIIK